MHYRTRNVCCVVVKSINIFISQFRNQISITLTHVLQYVFMHTKWSNFVQFMYEVHPMIKYMLCSAVPQHISGAELYTRKYLIMMNKYIDNFHTIFLNTINTWPTPPWDQTSGIRELQCRHFCPEGVWERQIHCGDSSSSGYRGNVRALSSTPTALVPGRQEVDYGTLGVGLASPYGVHPGDGLSSLQEIIRIGYQLQLGSLSDPWVPTQRHPEVTLTVPWAEHTAPPPPPNQTDDWRSTF